MFFSWLHRVAATMPRVSQRRGRRPTWRPLLEEMEPRTLLSGSPSLTPPADPPGGYVNQTIINRSAHIEPGGLGQYTIATQDSPTPYGPRETFSLAPYMNGQYGKFTLFVAISCQGMNGSFANSGTIDFPSGAYSRTWSIGGVTTVEPNNSRNGHGGCFFAFNVWFDTANPGCGWWQFTALANNGGNLTNEPIGYGPLGSVFATGFVSLHMTTIDNPFHGPVIEEQFVVSAGKFPAPPAPTGIAASDSSDPKLVHLSWNAVPGATGYQIYRNTVDDANTATLLGSIVTGTSFDDATAIPGVTYFYWIKAVDATSMSDFSDSNQGSRPQVAPSASNAALATLEDTALNGMLIASDANDEPLKFTIVTPPTKGTIVITNPATGAFTYTPKLNMNGADQFTFKANDGTLDSNVATVSIGITPVNDAPVATNDGTLLNVGNSITLTVLANDYDVDGDTLKIVSKTAPANGHGTVTINANGTLTYTQTIFALGSETFTYTISDGHGGTATATVTVTLNLPASVGFDLLATQIQNLNLKNAGQVNSLMAKLAAAQKSIAKGNTTPAINQLDALIKAIQTLVAPPAVANSLISQINDLKKTL
jgi:fibronectin type 3 domain-containing protein